MDDLLEYRHEIYNGISIDADANERFPEESYFEYVTDLLSSAGILDNVEYRPYKNTRKGIRLDGYSWNALEKTLSGIVVNFGDDQDTLERLTKTEITAIGKRVIKFFNSVEDDRFIESLDPADPGRVAASEIRDFSMYFEIQNRTPYRPAS